VVAGTATAMAHNWDPMGIRTPAVTTARVTMAGGSVVGMSPVRMAQPMLEELVLKLLGNIAQKLRVTRWPSR
jgi:hypothetical protein